MFVITNICFRIETYNCLEVNFFAIWMKRSNINNFTNTSFSWQINREAFFTR